MIQSKAQLVRSLGNEEHLVSAQISGITNPIFKKLLPLLKKIGQVGSKVSHVADTYTVDITVTSHFSVDAVGKVSAVLGPHTFRDLIDA